MQLRQQLSLYPETLSDFARAAEQKYWEGIELAVAGRPGAGIYLLGYAAEMLLKVACFRLDRAKLSDPIEPRLAPARNWLRSHPWAVPHESYHSLLFWMTYLRARRAALGQTFERNLDGQLRHHVQRLYSIWWVEMRYRPDQATAEDVGRVVNDITWLRDHLVLLWRK